MPAISWTTNVVCAGLLATVLSGCRSREDTFRATRVPVARFDSILKSADSVRLPLADARLLLGVAADSGTLSALLRMESKDRKSTRLNSSH